MLIYRALVTLLALPVALMLLWRVLRGAEAPGTRLAVLRGGGGRGGDGPALWLHAASNGELASVRPLLMRLMAARPDLRVLVTTNSVTGRDLARSWGLAAECAPPDLRWMVRLVLRRWRVAAHLSLESELWPNRVAACAAQGVPVIVLGARMSARTARGWRRVPGLAPAVMGRIAYLSAQDAGSARRFAALGLPEAACGPVLDLKAFYLPPDSVPGPAPALPWPRGATWLAASTHEGEERIVIEAHRLARRQRPDLRLILAPRHPARAEAAARLLDLAGLSHIRRSVKGAAPDADVLLADTMGEMALWYDMAALCFVGGSLTDRGGHTPFEPAAHGCTILHGPHLRNFEAPYAALAAAQAAVAVQGAQGLADAVLRLLGTPEGRRMAETARTVLAPGGAAGAVLDAVRAVLPPPAR